MENFKPLTSYLRTHGITHCISCPHTLEQNGYTERKYCHISKTSHALLYHSSVSPRFWTNAFDTAVYLINCLPTPRLNHRTPYEVLFTTKPDYSILYIFRYSCYHWLHPYLKSKLEPQSKPYVFLGYSHAHKGHKCFDPSLNNFFLSPIMFFFMKLFFFFRHLVMRLLLPNPWLTPH